MSVEPLSRKRLTTRSSLQSAALRLVAERGFTAVTVDDIATAARVSRRTFFNHFPTKVAAIFDPSPDLAGRLAELLDAADPEEVGVWEAVRSVCLAYAEGSDERLPIHRQLIEEDPDLAVYQRIAYAHFADAMTAWLNTHLEDRPAVAGLVREMAFAVMFSAFLTWSVDDDPAVFYELVDQGFTLASAGLGDL